MRPELRKKMDHFIAMQRLAKSDGYQTWNGWVWTVEPPNSEHISKKVCPVEEYAEYRERR